MIIGWRERHRDRMTEKTKKQKNKGMNKKKIDGNNEKNQDDGDNTAVSYICRIACAAGSKIQTKKMYLYRRVWLFTHLP